MDKRLSPSHLRIGLITLQAIVALAFAVVRYFINTPPSLLDILEYILLSVFIVLMIFNIWIGIKKFNWHYNFWNWLTLLLLAAILGVSLITGYPSKKTYAEALQATAAKQQAAALGYDLAAEIKTGTKDAKQVQEFISKLDKESAQAAQAAINASLETNQPKLEIVKQAAPTIPVKINEWTCVEIGCSFADNEFIWTISSRDVIYSALLNGVILAVATWIINTPIGRKSSTKNA
jgi:hypothetical protein